MAGQSLAEAIQRLGRFGGLQDELAQPDARLLERFARRRDEAAFAALLARHGPMVLSLCRRLLPDERDAEDAFQAAVPRPGPQGGRDPAAAAAVGLAVRRRLACGRAAPRP